MTGIITKIPSYIQSCFPDNGIFVRDSIRPNNGYVIIFLLAYDGPKSRWFAM